MAPFEDRAIEERKLLATWRRDPSQPQNKGEKSGRPGWDANLAWKQWLEWKIHYKWAFNGSLMGG